MVVSTLELLECPCEQSIVVLVVSFSSFSFSQFIALKISKTGLNLTERGKGTHDDIPIYYSEHLTRCFFIKINILDNDVNKKSSKFEGSETISKLMIPDLRTD